MNENIDDPQKEALPGTLSKGLNKREEVCLRLLIPNSGTEWLDELIKEARKEIVVGGQDRIFDSAFSEPTPTWGGHLPVSESEVKD